MMKTSEAPKDDSEKIESEEHYNRRNNKLEKYDDKI